MTPPPDVTTVDPDLVEVVARATSQHYLSGVNTQAGHELCSCEQWADGGMDEDWEDHLAQVALAALAEYGALIPTGGERVEEFGYDDGDECCPHVCCSDDDPANCHSHRRTVTTWPEGHPLAGTHYGLWRPTDG